MEIKTTQGFKYSCVGTIEKLSFHFVLNFLQTLYTDVVIRSLSALLGRMLSVVDVL